MLVAIATVALSATSRAAVQTTPVWATESNIENSLYGIDVSTAGDVNGDGYSDIIVGSQYDEVGEAQEGKVWLYYGTASGPSVGAGWRMEGDQQFANFGNSLGAAGDVNGDGYDDVIVGASGYGNGQASEGRAYVYHGSAAGLSETPTWTEEINIEGARFGSRVCTAGDVNNDGYDDVLVYAPSPLAPTTLFSGGVYLYLGSAAGLAASPASVKFSAVADTYFGIGISSAGDVNGDNYDDIVIGANGYENGQAGEGIAHVYLGNATGLTASAVRSWEGNAVNANVGWHVGCAGDTNGDGYSDVLVTAGMGNPCTVSLHLGGPSGPDGVVDWQQSVTSNSTLGEAAFTGGDLNGDGYADVMTGDGSDDGSVGAVYVFLGSDSGLPGTHNQKLFGDSSDSGSFGRSGTTAGDTNGDGYSDLIVGAPFFENGSFYEGKVYVYLGGPDDVAETAAWIDESNQDGAGFGISVTSGDWNGDGYSDVATGAWFYDAGQTNEGAVFAYYGNRGGISTVHDWLADGDQASALFGYAIANAGDTDGDGYDELLVGSSLYDNGVSNEGQAFLYRGGSGGLAATASWTAKGNQAGASWGYSVSSAGDVNGDGYADVLVGAPNHDNGQVDEGRASVYFGSASGPSRTPNWGFEGNETDASVGFSVACAGDVNGDGYSDVIVGAPGADFGQSDEGVAFVFYGGASGLPVTPSAYLDIDQAESSFGISVSSAGDVNGDGYSDVIVGASRYDNGESNEGAAFVFHGGPSGISTSWTWFKESNQVNANRGEDVASAGDVNGDGYSDVLIGTPYFLNGPNESGRAVVYLGSASGLGASGAWIDDGGAQDGARFSAAIACAGDITGDGFSDVIVGAPDYDGGLSNEGRAFIFYGNVVDPLQPGLDRAVQQRRMNGNSNIGLLGDAEDTGDFILSAYARTPRGRGKVRVEYQIRDTAEAWGSQLQSGAQSYNTGTPLGGLGCRVLTTTVVAGLSAETTYHWRMRFASDSPFFPHTPWLSKQGNGSTETDLRTAPASTGVEDLADGLAGGASLRFARVFPNPFMESISIGFALVAAAPVHLTMHDASGRHVATIFDGPLAAGAHSVQWSGENEAGRVANGVYFARLTANGVERTKKIVLRR